MIEVMNIHAEFKSIDDLWTQKTIGNVNNISIKLVKFKGEFKWHYHEKEDELFMVMKGNFKIMLKSRTLVLNEGELVIIPRGIEHKPVAEEEVHVMLVEPATTVKTGSLSFKKE